MAAQHIFRSFVALVESEHSVEVLVAAALEQCAAEGHEHPRVDRVVVVTADSLDNLSKDLGLKGKTPSETRLQALTQKLKTDEEEWAESDKEAAAAAAAALIAEAEAAEKAKRKKKKVEKNHHDDDDDDDHHPPPPPHPPALDLAELENAKLLKIDRLYLLQGFPFTPEDAEAMLKEGQLDAVVSVGSKDDGSSQGGVSWPVSPRPATAFDFLPLVGQALIEEAAAEEEEEAAAEGDDAAAAAAAEKAAAEAAAAEAAAAEKAAKASGGGGHTASQGSKQQTVPLDRAKVALNRAKQAKERGSRGRGPQGAVATFYDAAHDRGGAWSDLVFAEVRESESESESEREREREKERERSLLGTMSIHQC